VDDSEVDVDVSAVVSRWRGVVVVGDKEDGRSWQEMASGAKTEVNRQTPANVPLVMTVPTFRW
jgi:hypothetical protein